MLEMIVSEPEQPMSSIMELLKSAEEEVIIFSPYIKTEVLDKLEIPVNIKVTIITTLRLNDLLSGASDISLFPYSQAKEHIIFINNSLHLKAYLADWNMCIFGSSNLTGRGLALSSTYNYELNSTPDSIDISTKIYFHKILAESQLMNSVMYDLVLDEFSKLPPKIEVEELNITSIESDKDYLISSLPMSLSIARLYHIIINRFETDNREELECAIHDCVLYQLPTNIGYDDYLELLKTKFFTSDFIIKLMCFIDEKERYFGEVKAWIQNNCADVPIPSKRTLTANIQVLYRWIVELSDGMYCVDRPSYSERIYRVYLHDK